MFFAIVLTVIRNRGARQRTQIIGRYGNDRGSRPRKKTQRNILSFDYLVIG